ncbi:interferon-induced protein 35 [Centropristis striata]|uniref:interferon-induced protein 35 n=1 Tax=Centropristis striata TaxID=184440 RepID=UPI0027DEE622|nr:interferon-induced protein 35 [Centropristis striata]
MASDEDFSLVMELTKPSEETLEGVKALITNYKKMHEQLMEEQKELKSCRNDLQDMTNKCKQRSVRLTQGLKEDERSYKEQIGKENEKLNLMMQEEGELLREIQRMEEALKKEGAKSDHLKQQTDVFSAVPEREVVFTGLTGNGADTFEIKPHIVYPMEGGTVLITFEEEVVAKKILDLKKHKVDLGSECSITVEARPVHLMLPRLVEIDTEVSPQHVLISDLPEIDPETLLNKLEIHFSKQRHGGGEVDSCEMLPDSGTVVISFVEKHIARGLTDQEYHDVKLQQKMHRVRVTPFINGKITDLQAKLTPCARTLLLTGIPAIMEQETLQDLLEIHFQKIQNGGGEIEAFLYNPLGQQASALFEGVPTDSEEDE